MSHSRGGEADEILECSFLSFFFTLFPSGPHMFTSLSLNAWYIVDPTTRSEEVER